MFKYAPLMCKDIVNSKNNVKFKHCLLYGKIMCKQKESVSDYKYILDDGTAFLKINVFRKTDNLNEIYGMENELQAVRREMLAQNKNEIVNCLLNLLFQAKQQVDSSDLQPGTNILAYGKPNYHRGEITFDVYCFIKDGRSNRDIEIHFKDYLIYCYKNQFLAQ